MNARSSQICGPGMGKSGFASPMEVPHHGLFPLWFMTASGSASSSLEAIVSSSARPRIQIPSSMICGLGTVRPGIRSRRQRLRPVLRRAWFMIVTGSGLYFSGDIVPSTGRESVWVTHGNGMGTGGSWRVQRAPRPVMEPQWPMMPTESGRCSLGEAAPQARRGNGTDKPGNEYSLRRRRDASTVQWPTTRVEAPSSASEVGRGRDESETPGATMTASGQDWPVTVRPVAITPRWPMTANGRSSCSLEDTMVIEFSGTRGSGMAVCGRRERSEDPVHVWIMGINFPHSRRPFRV